MKEMIDAILVDTKKIKGEKPKPEPVKPDKKVEGEPCGDCYGAGDEDECCNTCAQVIAAYKAKHWGVKKADITQCVEEGDLDDTKVDEPRHTYDDDEYYGEDRPDDDVAAPRGYGDDDESMAAAHYGDDEYMRHGYGESFQVLFDSRLLATTIASILLTFSHTKLSLPFSFFSYRRLLPK